jgi:hypothetical protein
MRWVAVAVLSVLLMFDAVQSFDQYYRTPSYVELPVAVFDVLMVPHCWLGFINNRFLHTLVNLY